MEGFEGLASAFNIENETSLEEIENHIQLIEEKKNLLIQGKNENAVIFQDQMFIQSEIRSLIAAARGVMLKLEQNLKVGSHTREFEVYAKLLDSVGNQYRALLELNKAIFDALMETNKFDPKNIGDQKISLTSEQLLDMVDKARERSEINLIDADFTVENSRKK